MEMGIPFACTLKDMLGKEQWYASKGGAEQYQSQANAMQENNGAVHWKALPRCWQTQSLRLVPDLHMTRYLPADAS